jgi:hypothetical protein
MKRLLSPKIQRLVLAAGVGVVALFTGGCAVGYDTGMYSGAVYDSGWGGPYGYGYTGAYYGSGYYNRGYYGRGGYNRPGGGYYPGHHGNWGPGSSQVRPPTSGRPPQGGGRPPGNSGGRPGGNPGGGGRPPGGHR